MNNVNKKLLYSLVNYIILLLVNYNIDIKMSSDHLTIKDYIIGGFFLSFIIYCFAYFISLKLNNNNFTYNAFMSIWNQINTNGALFVIVSLLYFKVLPVKLLYVILFILIIIVYYPLTNYISNYILNESYNPNPQDILKAINYSENFNYKLYDINKIKFHIGLNESDSSEIIIDFKGTDIKEIENTISNLSISIVAYKSEYASNPDMIKDLSTPVGVHFGYFQLYMSIRNVIYEKCKELLNNGATKIFISGYSLGAGLSTICTFDLHANLNNLAINANNINSVHLAGPSIGDRNFVKLYNKYVINTVRVVHINDPIPRVTEWLYEQTKNQYILYSNVFAFNAHMLTTYRSCVLDDQGILEYISKSLLIYSVVFAYLIFLTGKYYSNNNN